MCYVYIDRVYEWREAGTGLNYFLNYIKDVLETPITYALSVFAQMTPIDGFVTVISGTDINNLEQNQIIAGGFLLFEVVPNAKILRPVTQFIPGSALKFIARKAYEIIELFDDAGTIKFTSKSVDDLAEKATKNKARTKVMLGRFEYLDTPSYIDRAGKEYKYFDIDNTIL